MIRVGLQGRQGRVDFIKAFECHVLGAVVDTDAGHLTGCITRRQTSTCDCEEVSRSS